MRRGFLLLIVLMLGGIALTGCARQTQKNAINSALNAENSDETSVSEDAGTTVPAFMPSELQLPNATIELSTTVEDGYQVSYSSTQSVDDVKTFYASRDGWKVVAEFAAESSQSVTIERDTQRVLVTIQPKGNATSVLVTGSFVKDLKTGN